MFWYHMMPLFIAFVGHFTTWVNIKHRVINPPWWRSHETETSSAVKLNVLLYSRVFPLALPLQNVFYSHVEILIKTFRSNPRILLTIIADCRVWCRTFKVTPPPISCYHSAVLRWVVIVRLCWSPVVEISTGAEICISQRPLPSGEVIAEPNPRTSATALQYTHQPVAFFLIFYSGKVSEHLSAVALSLSPGLWHLYMFGDRAESPDGGGGEVFFLNLHSCILMQYDNSATNTSPSYGES